MNPAVAFVVISAVAYFASSVFRTKMQERSQPAELFAKLLAGLNEAVKSESCVTKPNANTYLIWPKGMIGSVSYDGAFLAYVQPGTNQFKVTSFCYLNRKWTQIESQTVDPATFARNLSQLAFVPNSVRIKMLEKVGNTVPDRPPHGTKAPW